MALRNVASGDTVLLGKTGDASYVSKLVVPGTYDVFYSWSAAADPVDVPRNQAAHIDCARVP